jgi:citrate synthase
VSSIDHGPTPPSILTARAVFSGGNPLNAAVAAGVLAIGEVYGGAIERCARMLQEWAGQPGTPRQIAGELVADLSKTGERLPGFGHRLHVTDPRTVRLLALAREADIRHRHVDLAVAVEAELEHRTRKRLPMNINGAVAAVISDMGFDWRLGNGFFIISRAAGLVAHVYEEWTREESMRRLDPPPHEYDGPRARRLAT